MMSEYDDGSGLYAGTEEGYSAGDPNRKAEGSSNNSSNYGQYLQYAQIAANAGTKYNQIQDSNTGEYTKNQQTGELAGDTVTQGIGTAITVVSGATAIRKSATDAVGDDTAAAKTASNWMAAPHEAAFNDAAAYKSAETNTQKVGSVLATVGDLTGGTKIGQMFSYGLGKDKETSGNWGTYNDLSGISSRNNAAANVESERKSAEAAQAAAKEQQQAQYDAQQQASFNNMMASYKQPKENPGASSDPNRTSTYAHGGLSYDNPNARIEKQEMVRFPYGGTDQVDVGTHESGNDAEVNLPQGTQIF